MPRPVLLVALTAFALAAAPVGDVPRPATPGGGGVIVRYAAPVPGPVVRGFEPPPGPYSAGHRGVDFAVGPGEVVRAAAEGRVRFAGSVAGRDVVVIVHPDGVSTEYEPLLRLVSEGAAVRRGDPIGWVRGRHGSCAPDRCLHWGARRGGAYVDPMSLLRRLGPVRLLPWQ